jgi:type II secretory pathway component GspD/PulD (secretin)
MAMRADRATGCVAAALLAALMLCGAARAEPPITLALRDVELSEVMAMLSQQERVNILLGKEVGGRVSFNLYDVSVDEAVRSIANAAGYAVEKQGGTYFVVPRTEAGKYAPDSLTRVQSYTVQYAQPATLEVALKPYLSTYGKLTVLDDRQLVVVEDIPEFVDRISRLIAEMDRRPRQILIEARILEVTLTDEEAYGLDWKKLFESDGGEGSFGTTGLATPADSGREGFVFDLTNPNVEIALDALKARGRVRTLSTPKLLALENQEASVIVGDRRGYQVTTTINQVTTESIEFLESGVILRVTPTVDATGGVMMNVHPEVSTGSVDSNGIPSQVTTEVTTRLLVPSGRTVFIGGLIKHAVTQTRRGVPVLGDAPGIGLLFSNRRQTHTNTETVVLITPRVIDSYDEVWNSQHVDYTRRFEDVAGADAVKLDSELERYFPGTSPPQASPPPP